MAGESHAGRHYYYYYSQHLTTGGEKNIIGNLMMLYNMWQWKKRKVILELVL